MNMNLEKAREYFSAYNEGSLEKGLTEAFERALRTDAQVQAEYRAFERLMGDLEALKAPVPEPESDLHEIVSRRLDLHIHEQKRRTPVSLLGWWKGLALGGLATAALVMAAIQMRSGPTTIQEPMISSNFALAAQEKLVLKPAGNGFQLEYGTKGEKTITIRSADGAVLKEQTIKAGLFKSPLDNPNPTAKLLEITVEGEAPIFVAIPGTRMQPATAGEGSVKDLALAVAGFYRQPVMLSLGEEIKLSWSFELGEAVAAIEKLLAETKYTVQQGEGGVLLIQSN